MLSLELKAILDRSVDEARGRQNPTLTLEHVVYVMAYELDSARLLSACGAKVDRLRAELADYLDRLPTTGGDDLEQAVEFQTALQRATSQALSSASQQMTTGSLLAALLLEKTTYAVAALARHRVTRLTVTTYLTQGRTRSVTTPALPRARLLGRWRPAPRGSSDRYEIVLHNDDFTARAFVVDLLMTIFGRSRDEAEALTQEVHARGTGVAGVYPLREARWLVERATKAARSAEFPLRLSITPAA
jgi:ATP-dependent Clp protease adapter protein ClpS